MRSSATSVAVDLDRAGDFGAWREIDRAVDAAQERGLAGLGRADDAEDFVRLDVKRDAVDDFFAP